MFKKNIAMTFATALAIALIGCGSGGPGGTTSKPDAPTVTDQVYDQLKIRSAVWLAVSPPIKTNVYGFSVDLMDVNGIYRGLEGMHTERPSDLMEKYEKRSVFIDSNQVLECETSGNMTTTGKPILYNLNEFKKLDYDDCYSAFGNGEMIFLSGSGITEMTENSNIYHTFDWNLEAGKPGKYTKTLTIESYLRIDDKLASKANKNMVIRNYTHVDGIIVESRIVNDNSAESTVEATNYTLVDSQTEIAAGTPLETIDSSATQTLKTDSFIMKIVQTLDQSLYSVEGAFTLNDVPYSVKTITPIGKSGENVQGELEIIIGKEKINVLMLSAYFAKYSVDSDGNGTTDFSFDEIFNY